MLRTLKKQEDVELVGLLTTVNAQCERVAMHSTRLAILNAQASRAVAMAVHQCPIRISDACCP
jgi:hypothetical protein